ncbi:Lrp/AsnC ligand binding domain-containing protein [Saccharothrix longispora]|uniref:Lrp/AsnC ligand binding domain-containing protein n=1 Tax=Saccharothrix longispora TaxID=33920 RepID=UPI0031E92EFD
MSWAARGASGRRAAGSASRHQLQPFTGDEDFLLHVAVPDNESLYTFVVDRLTERVEVADVRTSVVYQHLRNDRITPLHRP